MKQLSARMGRTSRLNSTLRADWAHRPARTASSRTHAANTGKHFMAGEFGWAGASASGAIPLAYIRSLHQTSAKTITTQAPAYPPPRKCHIIAVSGSFEDKAVAGALA